MSQSALATSEQLELETLRDQRDLYRSLLLSEPAALALFLRRALQRAETDALAEATLDLHLPTVNARLTAAQTALQEIQARNTLTGNDLLPVMVVLEELCCHLAVAADCAQLHLPWDTAEEDGSETELASAQPKLALALQQLAERIATEHGKQVCLVTLGLEDVPPDWTGPLFDLLAALVRNAIEHGIEPPEQRAARAKLEQGMVVVELIDHGVDGFELHCNDDGGGLDAERIVESALKRGLLDDAQARQLEPARLVSLIFQPGVSTARDAARRGQGLQIVRSHLQRLDGRVQVATKRGQFTRVQMTLPPYATADEDGERT